MANEQAANNAKKSRKINFYKFVGKVEEKKGVLMSVGNNKLVTAVNGVGGTLNGIARVLDEYVKLSASNFLKEQKLKKVESTETKKVEKKKGLGGGAGVTKATALVGAAFGGFLSLFSGLFKTLIMLPVLNWISKPENKKKLENIVGALADIGKFLFELVSGVVGTTLELIAGFTKLPFWKEILKFGLFFAALGTSFLAFKKLFGGKAAKVVVKMVFGLFKGFFTAMVKFSAKLAASVARRGLRGAKGLLKGGRGFKGKGGLVKGALGAAAITFGTSFALDRAADAMSGEDLKEFDDDLKDLEKDEEKQVDAEFTRLTGEITKAVSIMDSAANPSAKDKAEPSPTGAPQPATAAAPTKTGGVQPPPEPKDQGSLKPATPPPTGSSVTPSAGVSQLMAAGGRLRKRAAGGPVEPGARAPQMQQQQKKVSSLPLSALPKLIGKTAPVFNVKEYAAQAKLLPKLFRLPMKVVGLATLGIITNIAKVLSKVPGAGLFVGTIEGLIAPIASAFGLQSNVTSKMKGAGIAQAKEMEKKKTRQAEQQQVEQQQEQTKKIEQQQAKVAEVAKKKNIFEKAGDGVKGFFGNLFQKKAGGGWIQGPQTGYPVSLDGGKSVSFIGHGTEYVATKSGGGSAFVIPYDTPATRGNKNLTARRQKEATSAGFKFSNGGRYRDENSEKREEQQRELKFSGDPRPPYTDKKRAEGGKVDQSGKKFDIIAGAKKTIGLKRGVGDMCAFTTRAALAAAGHPAAEQRTKKGDLDSEGTKYSGRNFAASLAGSDIGEIIRSKGAIKAGDLIFWRQDANGRYKKGAVTHIGIAADDGLKNQYDHNRSKGFQYRPHWHGYAGTSWFAGVRLNGNVNAGAGTDPGAGGDTTGAGGDTTGGGDTSSSTSSEPKTAEQRKKELDALLEGTLAGSVETAAKALFGAPDAAPATPAAATPGTATPAKAGGGRAAAQMNAGMPKLSKQQLADMEVEDGKGEAKSPIENGWTKFANGGLIALGKLAAGGKLQNGRLPEDVLQSIGGGHKLHKSVAGQFLALKEAAKKDGFPFGSALRINSSYRSLQRQKELYASLGPGTAAYPGTSNHGWGKAVDLWYTDGAYKWLRKNAGKFGFTQIPGYATDNPNGHEAWHWENLTGGGNTSPTATAGSTSQPGEGPAGIDPVTGQPKTGADEAPPETPEQKVARMKEMLSTALGKMTGAGGLSLFSQSKGGTDMYDASRSVFGGGTSDAGVLNEEAGFKFDKSTIKAVQPGLAQEQIKAAPPAMTAPSQNNNIKGATESTDQLKSKVKAQKTQASIDLAQKTQQSNANAMQAMQRAQQVPKNGASGSTIDIPVAGGRGEDPDDVILYRPGFGLFAGLVNAGGSGL